LKCEVY